MTGEYYWGADFGKQEMSVVLVHPPEPWEGTPARQLLLPPDPQLLADGVHLQNPPPDELARALFLLIINNLVGGQR